MKKIKKPAKAVFTKRFTPAQLHRRYVLFGLIALGSFVLVLGMVHGYMSLTASLSERAIVRGLRETDEQKLLSAIRAIGRGRSENHLADLCRLLEPGNSLRVREEALRSIAFLRANAGVPALVATLGDPSRSLAEDALKCLQGLAGGDITWETVIDWWDAHRADYAEGAASPVVETPAVPGLEKMLKSDDKYERKEAVERLEKLKHVKARAALETAAADPEPIVRAAAEEALKTIRVNTAD